MMRLEDSLLRERLLPVQVLWEPTTLRRAAVLAPVFARGGEDWLLFTVRRADLRQHGGQISFPGGMQRGDESPTDCALREAAEEIGIDPATVVLLGSLPARQSSSQIRVHCLVGRVPDPAGLRIDTREVERLLAIPWRDLGDLQRWQQRTPPAIGQPGAAPRLASSPHFDFGSDVVWGLTGRFAFDLVTALAAPPPGSDPHPHRQE